MGISLKLLLLKFTPEKLVKFYQKPILEKQQDKEKFASISFAQEGEDSILDRFLNYKKEGFYIDIGAHHPRRFSNTYIFYQRGWTGINIDAMPGAMDLFNKERPRDLNLEIGISKENKELEYYIFNERALNTFSRIEAEKKDGLSYYKLLEKKLIPTLPLKDVLRTYLDPKTKIDFMSIDVEGYDLEVLESNDWEKYRPVFILVEDLEKFSIDEITKKSNVYHFLKLRNYKFVAKTLNTLFFKDSLV